VGFNFPLLFCASPLKISDVVFREQLAPYRPNLGPTTTYDRRPVSRRYNPFRPKQTWTGGRRRDGSRWPTNRSNTKEPGNKDYRGAKGTDGWAAVRRRPAT